MAANCLIVKLLLQTTTEIHLVFFFGENERFSFGMFNFRYWLRKDKIFCFVALLHQMAAVIHFSDFYAFLVVSIASRSQKSRYGAGSLQRIDIC